MISSFADSLIVWLGLVVLGLNVVGLLTLLMSRPAPERRQIVFAPHCRACAAEALGTFALVLFGSLACLGAREPAALVVSALAHGLVLTVCVAGLGALSGGHFNPAVTAGFVATGRLSPAKGLSYLVCQLIGAVVASALLAWLFGGPALAKAVPGVNQELVPLRGAFVLEAAATFVLVLVVFGTAKASPGLAPVAIGASVSAGILAIGAMTGGALNPARHLGPALFAGVGEAWLVYAAGPVVGAVLAAVLMHFYLLEPMESPASPAAQPEAPQEARPRQAA